MVSADLAQDRAIPAQFGAIWCNMVHKNVR